MEKKRKSKIQKWDEVGGATEVEIDEITSDAIEEAAEEEAFEEEKLDELVESVDVVVERRGMGLMQGLELSVNPKDVIARALDNGLILFSAGTNVIRFVPPLVITKADVNECIAKLKKSF